MRYHAFGSDRVFAVNRSHGCEVDEVVNQLVTQAALGDRVRVGRNAWFVNNRNDLSALSIGNESVLRGCLRVERFRKATLQIGDRCYLGDDTIISCAVEIRIGSYVLIAHGTEIYDNDSHPVDPAERRRDIDLILGKDEGPRPEIPAKPVVIGDNVWIGSHCKIMKGVSIGDDAVVAAGSIVTQDIPAGGIAAGNTAKLVGSVPGYSKESK
jgi:acetyltransferase-like isoleucine patch superfamily enzyme